MSRCTVNSQCRAQEGTYVHMHPQQVCSLAAGAAKDPAVEEVSKEEQQDGKEGDVAHDLAVAGGLGVHLLDTSKAAPQQGSSSVKHVRIVADVFVLTGCLISDVHGYMMKRGDFAAESLCYLIVLLLQELSMSYLRIAVSWHLEETLHGQCIQRDNWGNPSKSPDLLQIRKFKLGTGRPRWRKRSMSGGVYGGDEVGALVFDFGSHTIRAGYAGEDTPKADIPSYVGIGTSPDSMETDSPGNKKHYVGTTSLHVPREGMELTHLLNDGLIENWDLFEKVMDYFYEKNFKTDSEYHPVLFSEAPWNAKPNREKLTEIMFEKYKVPAFFLCKTAVLSAFASGRPTALVIDSGGMQTSCTPVYDGYALTQAMLRTPLAGDFVTAQVRSYFEEAGVEIVPSLYIASKDAVKEGAAPVWSQKKSLPEGLSKSFHQYMVNLLLQDFTASVGQVSETLLADEIKNSSSIPLSSYEFPNGYNLSVTLDRFKFSEGLYDASTQNLKSIHGGDLLAIPKVAIMSANMVDIDIRPSLYANTVVVGGNSLLTNFTERLSRELNMGTPPNMKVKMVPSSGTVERRFSSWIGGSILASLGTFQQMWVSKREYEETGRIIVEKKCP